MRIAVDLIESIRYKLRVFGIPLKGTANVCCDNKSIVSNLTGLTFTLKKKRNSIAYHHVHEAVVESILKLPRYILKTFS